VRILVAGRLAGVRQGGATWAVLQYVLGLRRLGHDVAVWDPNPDPSYLAELVERFDLRLGDDAELLLNISGVLRDERVLERIPVRAYIDLDPAFTQLWHEQGEDVGLSGHTHLVTIGWELDGWFSTLQPVVLDEWSVAGRVVHDAFTTVGNWRSYGSIEHGGVFYGQRAHSLRKLLELPRRADSRFVLALAIDPGERSDLAALAENGWTLVDPSRVAGTPDAYREFVQGSRAGLCVAKLGYAESRCGWFSDRSACYLASGRPVVAQETGFPLPRGEGLLAFTDVDDAAAAVEALQSDYDRHARAARELAEEYLDSNRVLPRLLEALA
jgi:hypothetical protein